ncbi:hypothetical protein BV22DRAFT_1056473 [Leucogyrophana mollusca]|uniref:Uncharacterized protein n=1 Tax=Leucogyrophana mollusca TaxID=85980 RepID=A0ACB8BUJ6_9AGAM|nr:hypothetical protein BV22DRAFT_1056473 [Leucogyrophana mollusca]
MRDLHNRPSPFLKATCSPRALSPAFSLPSLQLCASQHKSETKGATLGSPGHQRATTSNFKYTLTPIATTLPRAGPPRIHSMASWRTTPRRNPRVLIFMALGSQKRNLSYSTVNSKLPHYEMQLDFFTEANCKGTHGYYYDSYYVDSNLQDVYDKKLGGKAAQSFQVKWVKGPVHPIGSVST